MTETEKKLREVLKDGPKDSYEVAAALWPPKTHPRAWRYSSNGGPPGWAMTLGRIAKRYGIRYDYRDAGPPILWPPIEWRDAGSGEKEKP